MIPENTEQKVLARKLQVIGYVAKLFCCSSSACVHFYNIYCNNYSDNTSFLMPMLWLPGQSLTFALRPSGEVEGH